MNGNFHIEHFRPRAAFERLTYQWRNLLASCETWNRGSIDGDVVETQRHCGDAKDNWFEADVTVDPQSAASVEALFRFPLNGKIYPSKALRSRYPAVERTIEKLNLNAPSLIKRRERLLAIAAADTERMTRNDWQRHYLEAGADGSLQEFWSALQYNFERHWRQIWP